MVTTKQLVLQVSLRFSGWEALQLLSTTSPSASTLARLLVACFDWRRKQKLHLKWRVQRQDCRSWTTPYREPRQAISKGNWWCFGVKRTDLEKFLVLGLGQFACSSRKATLYGLQRAQHWSEQEFSRWGRVHEGKNFARLWKAQQFCSFL